MPTVPRISVPDVQQSRTPNVALQGNADPRAFGAGVGQALGVAGQVAKDAHDLQVETQIKAQRSALIQWELEKVDDPKNGAMGTKGVDALGVHEKVIPDLDKRVAELEDGIKSPRGKVIFRQMADSFRQDVTRKLNTHAEREGSIYAKEQTDATLALSMEAAAANAGDPNRVANELKYSAGVALADARRLGMSPEATKDRLMDVTTGIHAAVLDRMLTSGSYVQAKAYFDANGQDMTTKARDVAGKMVQQGYARVEGKAQADALFRKHGTDFASVNAGLKDIKDPMVRDVAEVEVTQERERLDAAKRAKREQAMQSATNIVEASGDFNKIPPMTLEQLSVHDRSALKNYAAQKSGGADAKTDPATYERLRMMAANEPEKFVAESMLSHIDKLNDADFKKMVDLQAKTKNGADDPDVAKFRTLNQRVDERLVATFGDTTTKDKAKMQQIIMFRTEFETRKVAMEQETGKSLTGPEATKILDEMTMQVAVGRSRLGIDWLAGDDVVPAYSLRVQDIPSKDRLEIEEALRATGRPVTDAAILGLYTRGNRAPAE